MFCVISLLPWAKVQGQILFYHNQPIWQEPQPHPPNEINFQHNQHQFNGNEPSSNQWHDNGNNQNNWNRWNHENQFQPQQYYGYIQSQPLQMFIPFQQPQSQVK